MGDALQLPDDIAAIPDALAFWAEARPRALALRATDGRELSHRRLREAILQVVGHLAARGITRQARVALLLPAGFDACVALLGVMAGAIAAPLNPAASAAELSRD